MKNLLPKFHDHHFSSSFSFVCVQCQIFSLKMDNNLANTIAQLSNELKLLTASQAKLIVDVNASCAVSVKVSRKLNSFSDKINSIKSDFDFFKRKERAKNILIFNLQDNDENNKDLYSLVSSIFQSVCLKIPDLSLNEVYTLGKTIGSRPIIVKFISARRVKRVFTKVTQFRNFNISVANDCFS